VTDLAHALGAAILDDEPEAPDPLGLVRRTADAEVVVRDLLRQAVGAARSAGHSWSAIGAELGMTRQAVQQRFGKTADDGVHGEQRWLGPVTAFDEMRELEAAGRAGWHTVGTGLLGHRMTRTGTEWEHRRVLWGAARRHEGEGWVVGARAFPCVYLIRDTGTPVVPASDSDEH
jgi:hypothetical protein